MKKVLKCQYPGVRERYDNPTLYSYYVPDFLEGIDFKEGDWVIVDSPYTAYTAVKVVEVLEGSDINATKPVIGQAALSAFFANKTALDRKKEIEAELEVRAKNLDKLTKYAAVAEHDERAAELLTELKSLDAR